MSSSSIELVLASSPDGPIVAYDPSTATPLASFNGSRSPRRGITTAGRTSIAVSHICAVTASGSIHLYNWWASSTFQSLPVPEPVAPITATPDGFYLFAGGLSGDIHTISLPSGDLLGSFHAHTKPVSCLRISNDGSLLISGGDDGSIVVIPIFQIVQDKADENASNYILNKFIAHNDSVTSIYSGTTGPSSSQIMSSSLDGRCRFWNLLSGIALHTVVFPCAIYSVVLDPTETEFYAAGSDGLVYKSSLRTNNKHLMSKNCELITWAPKHDGAVISVIMVNEGKNLMSAGEDGSIWVWEVNRGEVIMAIQNEFGSVSDLIIAKYAKRERDRHRQRQGGSHTHSHGCDSESSSRLCSTSGSRNLGLTINQTVDMQDVMETAGRDLKKAIDMLESAIAMYEKMLELILKEAKSAICCNKMKKKGINL